MIDALLNRSPATWIDCSLDELYEVFKAVEWNEEPVYEPVYQPDGTLFDPGTPVLDYVVEIMDTAFLERTKLLLASGSEEDRHKLSDILQRVGHDSMKAGLDARDTGIWRGPRPFFTRWRLLAEMLQP